MRTVPRAPAVCLALALWAVPAAAGDPPESGGRGKDADPTTNAPRVELSSDPHRIAQGLLFDTPVSDGVIDRSLEILAGLRRRYALEADTVANNEQAAARAWQEIEALEFTPEQIRREAGRLGYSLDPAVCEEACENVERLALLELRKLALLRLAGLKPGSPPSEVAPTSR